MLKGSCVEGVRFIHLRDRAKSLTLHSVFASCHPLDGQHIPGTEMLLAVALDNNRLFHNACLKVVMDG